MTEIPVTNYSPSQTALAAAATQQANVSSEERLLSILGGSLLALQGLRRLPGGLLLAVLGGGLLYRGITGRSSVYRALGFTSLPTEGTPQTTQVSQAITINRPVADVYRFWRDFTNLPRFMQHLEAVEVRDDTHSHWVAKGPAGSRIEWDAEMSYERENALIAWRSLPEADITHAGSVAFNEAPGQRGTEVHVTLQYRPPGGPLGVALARLLGEEPGQQVADDLRRLKRMLETGQVITTTGQPSARSNDPRPTDVAAPREPKPADHVLEGSQDSFPASDPPAWMAGNH